MRPTNLRARFVLVVAISAVLTVAIVLTFALRARHAVITDTQRKTLSTVEAFAQATGAWISRGDLDTVSRVADLMLSGSSLYVEVVQGDTTLVERIDTSWQGSPPLRRSSDPLSEPSGRFHRDRSIWYVDTLSPLTIDSVSSSTGYVRAGIDISFARARVAAVYLRTAGMGALAWIACCIVAFFALIGRSSISESPVERETAILKHGGLTIDTASVEIALNGRPIQLTPKQYELLTLLAAHRGGVVSDHEIVARLWPESAYADSNDVRQCVYKLRSRMNSVQPGAGKCIDNVKGFGYRLLEPEPIAARRSIKTRPSSLHTALQRDKGGRNE